MHTMRCMMPHVSKRIQHLYDMHEYYNQEYFGGKLRQPWRIVIKRAEHWDGKIWYFEGKKGTYRTSDIEIGISEGVHNDWARLYGTLLHEMIHQYQIQILGNNAPHDSFFNSFARHLERETSYPVR